MTSDSKPYKIILSSGPRGGKSVIAKKINEWFSKEYSVHIIDETARELFDGGLIYSDSPYKAQRAIIHRQLEKEREVFEKILASGQDLSKTIVVFDRTCIDAITFISDDEFSMLLKEENLSADDIAAYLHGAYVLHLQSLAVTLPDFYEKKNHASSVIRRESADEAAASDKNIYAAYEKYMNIFQKHVVIEATKNVEDKFITVKKEIEKILNI